MGESFTQYWRNAEFDAHEEGELIDHTASNVFLSRGVEKGAKIFIVTVRAGDLYVGAVIEVDRIVSRSEASAHFDIEAYDATDHVIAGDPRPFRANLRVPVETARKLRFAGDKSLTYTDLGAIDQQTLRGLRRLTAESADHLLALFSDGDAGSTAIADIRDINARSNISVTQKRMLIDARLGQGRFRKRVIELEGRCRITGVSFSAHLRASHIKPWCDATDDDRLNGNNGLLLSPHVDHLFDRGYIGFADDGTVLVSRSCPLQLLITWGIRIEVNVGPFRPAQLPFLAYHRITHGLR